MDTSAVVKLLVQESGSDLSRSSAEDAEAVITSQLTLVETRSALARMRGAGRITSVQHRATLSELAAFWSDTGVVDVMEPIVERAASLAEQHALRAYDAMHLASALAVAETARPAFGCWDRGLRTAAAQENLELVPSNL